MLSFFKRNVLDEIWDLIESISQGFLPSLLPLEDFSEAQIYKKAYVNFCSQALPQFIKTIFYGTERKSSVKLKQYLQPGNNLSV